MSLLLVIQMSWECVMRVGFICFIYFPRLLLLLAFYLSYKFIDVLKFVKRVSQHLTGVQNNTEQPSSSSETKKVSSTNSRSLSQDTNKPQRSKTYQEPVFTTNLTTPIEDVISECTQEEKLVKKTSKDYSKGSVKGIRKKKEETQNTKSIESKKNVEEKNITPEVIDNVGFSFFSVKGKGRSARKLQETKGQIENRVSKVSLEQPGQNKKSKIPVQYTEAKNRETVITNCINEFAGTSKPVEENLIHQLKFTDKPSKKVDSSLSYASVVLNNYPETSNTPFPSEKNINSENFLDNTHYDEKVVEDNNRDTLENNEKQICLNTENIILSESKSSSSIKSIDENKSAIETNQKAIFEPLIEVKGTSSISSLNNHLEVITEQIPIEVAANLQEDIENNSQNKLKITHSDKIFGCANNTQDFVNILVNNQISDDHLDVEVLDGKESRESLYSPKENIEVFDTITQCSYSDSGSTDEFLLPNNKELDIYLCNLPKPLNTEPSIKNYKNSIHISEGKVISQSSESNISSNKMSQIRILTLNDKEHQESTLYRLQKGWILQFRLGPSLFGRKVNLLCNYPEANNEFVRNQYTVLKWSLDEGCKNADDTALYTQIILKISGSFHYYFTYDENIETMERQGSGYILVDPTLKYGNNEELPLDCIQCQTVLAKGLGPFSGWEKKLKVGKESGYNMIHFTPIQKLGGSNSSYSLSGQLQLNPLFNEENGVQVTFDKVQDLISKLRREWKVTSICDIVLNHTANESEWLKEHPEATYNCVNCPYMRPAYLLDAAFHQFSLQIKKGLFEDKGIPEEVCTEDHLNAIRYHFKKSMLEPLNIPDLYTTDINKYMDEFLSLARKISPSEPVRDEELIVIQDPEFRRLGSKIDINLALNLYSVYRNDCFDEESRIKKCAEDFKAKVDSLNSAITQKVNEHLDAAIENIIAGIRYFRVQTDGPQIKEISKRNPLVHRYFTDYGKPMDIKEHEEIMYSSNGAFLMAHNGWVMNSDPLRNFAASDSNVYLRRELIAWGDSVKLRYGDKPEDSPYLWNLMKEYVELTARIFDGVRLDNCHSTPIPVAEYLLDCARKVQPNLYVVAELFTNSDVTDNIFVNRLGITSLIREAMSAWDSHEEGRLVYRYGGYPVGSFYQPSIRPLIPSIAHALFVDLTHDNPSPVEKRSVFDLLPTTALVNMACCASGSNRGYDELVPHHIHVVDETREYTEWSTDENITSNKYVSSKSGIIAAKRAINELHYKLGKEGFEQVYVDQMDADIVAVTRHCPKTHQSYILIAFTAFGHPSENEQKYQREIKPLRVEGVLNEIVLEATLTHVNFKANGTRFVKMENFKQDSSWINGLTEYKVDIKQHIQVNESDVFEKVDSGALNVTHLHFKNFKPGSIVVVKVSLPEDMRDSVNSVIKLIDKFSATKDSELKQIISKMTLADLNRALYRCDQEERDEGFGFDTYNIPNFGPMVYAGVQGIISLLANIRPNNDLGHPFCANLRDGNWMIEYVWKRLKLDEGTKELGRWLEENTKYYKNIPRYLVPCYFDVVITGVYILLIEQCNQLMSDFIKNGSTFVRGLSLGSVQFAAYIKSANLPTLSPKLAPPKPPVRKNQNGELVQACVTLSAGLPHFSVGYMRNWGRDTFISLRGLFILTGRFEEARQHILGYAACLRHGLIPNLLDGGRNPRYNCRDAVWWWLHCIKEYVQECPNGVNILQDHVSRIFPTDDSEAHEPGAVDQPLCEVMQEALKIHFQGLVFRERNAGRQIDEHMTDRGFNNQIGIHPETGFVFGGNEWNCGTWMDKMGSSDKAGNRGKPASPRDGSAIELIGLSKAVVTWLWKLSQEKKYPHNGVERAHKNGSVTKWTFKDWADKIQTNFEKFFWVNTVPVTDEIRPDLVNKRGIYKDTFGASQPWTDYQLRCNFPIAMVVAPELFNPQHAWVALHQAEEYLVGPLGMKTLDPEDWSYRGDYDNSNDSSDPTVAHGFNYHQGPEWLWPIGFFLRAKLIFASQNAALKETLASTKISLSKHFTELQTSSWRGLPELTNSNGTYCRESARTQAWSMSCILEVLHDLQRMEAKTINVN